MPDQTKTMTDDYGVKSTEVRKLPTRTLDSGNALISHDSYVLMLKEHEEAMESNPKLKPFPLWQSLEIYFKDGELEPMPKEFELEDLSRIGWLQITGINNSVHFFLEDGTHGFCKVHFR